MGHHDPDNRSGGSPESQSRAPARADTPEATPGRAPRGGEPKPAAVSSLMSVQIRRSRAPRKPVPCGPAPGKPAASPADQAPANPTDAPAARQPAARAAQPTTGTAGKREPQRREEITAYWSRLRGNRACPAVSDLDPKLIAASWPNSILFRCRAGSGALMPDMSFLPRQGASLDSQADDGKIQLSPMMLQWLVSLAEDAVRNQRPVEDLESFPSARRAIGYRAVAVPLSDDPSVIDHVLCHVKYA
jgi:hypothetical protein